MSGRGKTSGGRRFSCAAGRAAGNAPDAAENIPELVIIIPGVVRIISEVVDKYLQVFNLLLAKYSICFLSSIQCVACQVFINKPGHRDGNAAQTNVHAAENSGSTPPHLGNRTKKRLQPCRGVGKSATALIAMALAFVTC